jgi:hypothetical protein
MRGQEFLNAALGELRRRAVDQCNLLLKLNKEVRVAGQTLSEAGRLTIIMPTRPFAETGLANPKTAF